MPKIITLLLALLMVTLNVFAGVNVNTANEKELQMLTGIGPAKAKAIIDFRTKNGEFKAVDDLLKVPGIGPAVLGKMRSDVTLSGATTGKASAAPAAPAAKTAPPAAAPQQRLPSRRARPHRRVLRPRLPALRPRHRRRRQRARHLPTSLKSPTPKPHTAKRRTTRPTTRPTRRPTRRQRRKPRKPPRKATPAQRKSSFRVVRQVPTLTRPRFGGVCLCG